MGVGRWVVGAARTATEVSEGVAHAEGLAGRAARGVGYLGRGARGLHRTGLAYRHQDTRASGDAVRSGAAFYHTDEDREAALASLGAGFAGLRADVEPWATSPGAPAARAQWWELDARPALNDWLLFRDHQGSWVNRVATDWSTYEAWMTVLHGLRSSARAQGLALASPEPVRLPRTAEELGRAGEGSPLEAAWTLGKVLLYTAVGFAGVASLYTVWRDLRADSGARPG